MVAKNVHSWQKSALAAACSILCMLIRSKWFIPGLTGFSFQPKQMFIVARKKLGIEIIYFGLFTSGTRKFV